MNIQLSVFDTESPSVDAGFAGIARRDLGDGAWLEYLPQWLSGAGAVFDALVHGMRWRADSRQMYDRKVDVPRLTARLPGDGVGHPVLAEVERSLCDRYDEPLHSVGLALYRDGHDSVALHGDRLGERVNNAVIAIVSVGEPRRFLLKPRGGGSSIAFSPGWGDLLVMGGSCQRNWLHGVPKLAHAGPRISIQFRPTQGQAGQTP